MSRHVQAWTQNTNQTLWANILLEYNCICIFNHSVYSTPQADVWLKSRCWWFGVLSAQHSFYWSASVFLNILTAGFLHECFSQVTSQSDWLIHTYIVLMTSHTSWAFSSLTTCSDTYVSSVPHGETIPRLVIHTAVCTTWRCHAWAEFTIYTLLTLHMLDSFWSKM